MTPELVALLHRRQFVPQICDILANLGPGASAAIPTLQVLLATNYVMVPNTYAGRFEPQAVRQEIVPRWKVAQALASIAPHDSNVIAILREAEASSALADPRERNAIAINREAQAATARWLNRETRIPAAITLWQLGLETNPPLDELIAEAEEPNGGWAVDRLGDIGPAAKKALPVLEEKLKQRFFSLGAALAILKIAPEDANRLGLPGLFIICPDKY